jgi:hypothetical protein
MKWLIAFLLGLFMAAPAIAGEDPFVAIVGSDLLDANLWYLSPKEQQFPDNQTNFGVPVTNETFLSQMPIIQPGINIKLPVTGQINASGQTEGDLELGDLILIGMIIPRNNTVDIYCNAQSVKL